MREKRNIPEMLKKLSGLFVLLTCLTAIVLALLLYRSGAQPYTAAAVGRGLRILAIPAALLICCAIGAAVTGKDRGEPGQGAGEYSKLAEKPILRKNRGMRSLRTLLLAAAAVLIVLGICNGGMKDVFVKATKICSECIGLG